MSEKISIEIHERYRPALDVLKTAFSTADGTPVESDEQVVESLIESFVSFLQQQQQQQESSGGCCGGDDDASSGGGCCS